MIKLQNCTPAVYYNKSRDFQFIGRLYDVVLNSIKTNSELINAMVTDSNVDAQLVDLLALTMGFKTRHQYNVKQLIAVCSIFPLILKNKGTITAIKLIGNTLLRAEGITDNFSCYVDRNNPAELILVVPSGLSDKTLLQDLLNYVLPAGMTYKMIANLSQDKTTTISVTQDKIKIFTTHSAYTSTVVGAENNYTSVETPIADTPGIIGNITVVGTTKSEVTGTQVYGETTDSSDGGQE